MPSPINHLIVSRPPGVKTQMCRPQRRRLALRRKESVKLRVLPTPSLQSDQITIRQQLHKPGSQTFIRQSDEGETLLRAIVEACAASVAVLDESGALLYVSKPWLQSMEDDCLPAGRHLLDLKYLERWNNSNAESDRAYGLDEDIQDILDGKVTEFNNEYWCPGLNQSRWFVVHATRLELPGSTGAFRVLLNSEDTTRTRQAEEAVRDLGGRLITAQEEERSRVARELHDDLNQRMALLSIELAQLAQRIPADQDNTRQSIHTVWARAQEISSEIQRVSYQLHPSKLDHLGLLSAVKSVCNEVGAHHEIKITFRENGIHGVLNKEVTLCLYRIVQESLRNIIKHSGASEATVTLGGSEKFVHLSISDTGHGFDAGSKEAKVGLGLISMRERLRLVSGVIAIHSNARGTKIDVSVPIGSSKTESEDTLLMESVNQVSSRLQ